MEQFLDTSIRDLSVQCANLLEALGRSYDRLKEIIDMVFSACVVKKIDNQRRYLTHIMTEAFYEIHYPKITEEYKLYRAIRKQCMFIRSIYEVFSNYGITIIKDLY